MSMFCYQCQETAKNEGCTTKGVCGKNAETAAMQDMLIFTLRGLAGYHERMKELGLERDGVGPFVTEALFTTVTNVSFDAEMDAALVEQVLALRDELREMVRAMAGDSADIGLPDAALWSGPRTSNAAKAATVGVKATEDEDIRSLRELLLYGLKGMAAYAHHAAVLGYEKNEIYDFLLEGLAATTKDLSADELVALVLKTGEVSVTTMALLDEANTSTYGQPEISEVNLGVGDRPGILVSGHDLKDLAELLEQTRESGIDVYTHGEMLPAHYYPTFKKYDHLVGNYGGAWYDQKKEFESFGGPILMTTNCLVPVKDSYRDRLYTTGVVNYPGIKHIPDHPEGSAGGRKDFSALIEQARSCPPPQELESGSIVGGFGHHQVLALADKVVAAVQSGAIKRFVVMAGCDGRQSGRNYFTEVAKSLPDDTVILTAGCAKFRYNKLDLGDIGGIPRVLDAGQCNDSYSLAVVALKLKEAFGLADINELPISFDIAWYEQKAVAVLLALLHLGVKGIRLGRTLPAFLSPKVGKVLVDTFVMKPSGDPATDVKAIMAGS